MTNVVMAQVIPVRLTEEDFQLYYNGCCNATFWPLLHSMPDRAVFEENYWEAYRNTNIKFARRTIEAMASLQQVTVSYSWL